MYKPWLERKGILFTKKYEGTSLISRLPFGVFTDLIKFL